LTTPAFEAVMPVASAVVTEVGGLMSHTAICCREYGIPAVVGVAGATTHIPDGALVTVDPSTSRVLVVGTGSPRRDDGYPAMPQREGDLRADR
jgi:pyruvate,water dikinase